MTEDEHPLIIFRWRISIAIAILGVFSLILLLRVGYLQVYKFTQYQLQARGNRIQVLPTISTRGNILDRHGNLLAGHYRLYELKYYPQQSNLSQSAILEFLQEVINLTPKEQKKIEQTSVRDKASGITIRQNLSEEDIARISAHSIMKNGLFIISKLTRYYPEGVLLGHVTGYIGKLSEKDWQRINHEGNQRKYWGIDSIGKTGLEYQYEEDLRGTPGSKEVEVDATGREVRIISQYPSLPGKDIITTLDIRLQKVAHEAFKGRNGALVAIDPTNGEVLAMLSEASYDPNLFIEKKRSRIGKLFVDKNYPLLNRAVGGVYPPASTFKPFVGLAGLKLGKRTLTDIIFDPGYYSLPGSSHRYRDWKTSGHGEVNFHKSIVESVDTYYYGLAVSIGINNLSSQAAKFGFGRLTGIDLPGELRGLMPSSAWKEKRFNLDWFTGDTVSVGVGQGYMLATPLQVSHAYGLIANAGKGYQPHLLHSIRNPVNGDIDLNQPKPVRKINISNEYWQAVIKALAAVTQPGGTGSRAFSGTSYASAGKTGTAQVFTVAQNKTYNAKDIKKTLHDHAWYAGFAPVENPKIVIAVLLENAGGGSTNAAPIVRKVMDAFFNLSKLQTKTTHR